MADFELKISGRAEDILRCIDNFDRNYETGESNNITLEDFLLEIKGHAERIIDIAMSHYNYEKSMEKY